MDFFQELLKLRGSRPHPCILTVNSENADFCPYHARGKNSYMIIGHNMCEDCYYGFWVGLSRDCVDCAFVEKSELCYECVDCIDSYGCDFCQNCINCTSSAWCYDCKSCSNCFGCVNVRQKEYHIFNERYSKEEYFEQIKTLKKHPDLVEKKLAELKLRLPHNAMQGVHNEHVIGNNIYHSKNAFYCFDVYEQEDTMYMFNASHVKDALDCCYTGQNSELNYMCHSAVTLNNSNFCNVCWFSQNLEYCEYVFNSHDCFGCVSRNHSAYEILNVPYTKEEFFKKKAGLIDQLKNDGSYGRWWWPSPYAEIKPFSSYMA